jgi:hypothetical protein
VSKKKDKTARKVQRPQTVERPNKLPVSVPAAAASPQGAAAQSASSQATPPRLRTLAGSARIRNFFTLRSAATSSFPAQVSSSILAVPR